MREIMEETENIMHGKIINVRIDTALLDNGMEVGREVVEHPGGACILAMEDDGTVYTVRQFRYPFMREVEELPAGKLDGQEDHRLAAERELSEEVGVTADEMIYMGPMMASPGFCTEVVHGYFARGLHHGKQHLDEDEFLEVLRRPFTALVDEVMDGTITDGKTSALILKVQEYLRRERENGEK